LGVKGTIELNKLAISINYDAHSGSVFRGRSKGREHRGLLWSPKFFLGMLEGLDTFNIGKYYRRKKTNLSNIKQCPSMAWYKLNTSGKSRTNLLLRFHVGKMGI